MRLMKNCLTEKKLYAFKGGKTKLHTEYHNVKVI